MKTIYVGVSGLNAIDNPAPGVGVVKSLKDDKDIDYKIVGLSYDAMEPGNYMNWLVDRSYLMPYPSSSFEDTLERLLYIKESYGLDFIIPTLDAELPQYIKYADKLEEHGIKTFLPNRDQFKLRGKDCLAEVSKKIGIKIPKTKVVTSHSKLVSAVNNIGLPVMVKGAFYKADKVNSMQDAVNSFYSISAEWGYPIIVQEVVSGEEMNVISVGDGHGGSLGTVGIKKLSITSIGKIWTGVTVRNKKMLEAAERFLKEFKWRSAFELECMISGEDIYLIEINPRFPAWSYFATGVGVNLTTNMVRKAFDMPLLQDEIYPAGKLYIRYTHELITDMEPLQAMTTFGER